MANKILIATTNVGKFNIYKNVCDSLGLECVSPMELGVKANVDENGKSEVENAVIKAKAYHELTGLSVISNDSGLVIDKFSAENQPGVLVRRYKGKEMTDEEMLAVYVEKLNEVGGESTGHYNVALALINENGELFTKEFKPQRYFVNKPSSRVNKGMPLSSIAYDRKTGKYLSEMTFEERAEYEAEALQKQKEFIAEIFCKWFDTPRVCFFY